MHCPTLFSVVRCAPQWGLFLVCVFAGPEVRGESTSAARIDTLRQLAVKTLEARGADAPEDAVVDAVLAKFAEHCEAPVPPERDVVSREMCLTKVQSMLQQEAEKKFPMPSEEELAEEAADEYPMYQVGDPVSISFQPNPVRTAKASGVYQGRRGDSLKIGGRSILIRDISAVPENEDELLKFFPDQSREKRREYIARRRADVFAQRDQWKKEHRDEMLRLVLRKQTEANEARGYILQENRWSAPETILARMMPELRKQVREREQRRVEAEEALASAAGGDILEDQEPSAADGDEPQEPQEPQEPHEEAPGVDDADDVPKTTENVPDADATTADSATEVATQGNVDEESTVGGEDPAEDDSLGANVPAPSHEDTQKEQKDLSDTNREGSAVLPILAVIVGGLIAVAAILCWPAKERGRYYPGAGQAGEAISDPISRFADVPHVVARFPNRERALSMLAGVSFLSLSNKPGRELSCRLPLEYGFVSDENGTLLGFVAGAAFDYPLWRETRDLLHRSRDAELLSAKAPAPDVHVPSEGPVADNVSELGQFEGDDHDPSCYWLFQADANDAAKAFLKQAVVKSSGWYVIVQTPKGHWGRDAQGLYQE